MTVRFSAITSIVSVGLALGACALPDTDTFRAPDATTLFSARSISNYREKVLPPVTPADLVDASGNCAGTDASIPPVPAAIALEMTECDVVKRAGAGGQVQVGTGARGERTATLTFVSGERPGVYNFVDGRLKSMELGPEPVAPKTAKKPAKPAKRTPQPNQVSVQ
jgi:hypothetical protein